VDYAEIQLTEHFTLGEFAVSREFPEMADAVGFSDVEVERVRFACGAYLQPLRNALGPVIVTSGKRTPELNAAVGGHPRSDHLYRGDSGAVDFVVPGKEPIQVARWLRRHATFKLLIVYPTFCHLSFPDSSGRYGEVVKKNS